MPPLCPTEYEERYELPVHRLVHCPVHVRAVENAEDGGLIPPPPSSTSAAPRTLVREIEDLPA
ncbi:hypothetical protein [Kitasatospora sp. DSM 101779]|uniref:hypothetical protein n=1 Tax=Kitasatospora sp. DSM 101779 TaxID=2853165 RepID=UPI0021D9046E|nr:hypothetical protein [Kitasatospora sp. DSM 101779]MCU7821015.1 hypothetical protein [Kitasatospora sp. DSM 101779]